MSPRIRIATDGTFSYALLSLFYQCVTIEVTMKSKPIFWLPIDSRLLPSILHFGHVKGLARVFLEIEIVLSLLVVIGTLVVVALRLFPLK